MQYFPSPEYKRKIRNNEINEKEYGAKKEKEFLEIYKKLINNYQIKINQNKDDTFLNKWLLAPVRKEIDILFGELQSIHDKDIKKVIAIKIGRAHV